MARLDQLLKLHEADPTDADLPYMIALEHAKAGESDEALLWLERTLALNPDYHYAHFQRAKLLHDAGRTDEAVSALNAGIDRATSAGDQKALSELSELRATLGG